MSFILDALKKSESERQRQNGPALLEVKVAAPAARFPVWAVIVGVLLGVNLIVLIAVLLLRDGKDPAVQATRAQIEANRAAVAGAPTAAGSTALQTPATSDAVSALNPSNAPNPPGALPDAGAGRFNPPLVEEDPSLAEEPLQGARGAPINPADYQPAAAGQTPRLAAPDAYGPLPSSGTAASMPIGGPSYPTGTDPAAARATGGAQTSGVPSRDDLVAAGQGAIPEANLSLHVYDRNPAARFVFINGQRAREGEVLQNGLRIDEIRADGTVLSFRGARFLVPIQ